MTKYAYVATTLAGQSTTGVERAASRDAAHPPAFVQDTGSDGELGEFFAIGFR